jgi:DNA-binding PadR family transcriptional regulator
MFDRNHFLARHQFFPRPRPEGPFQRGDIKFIILQYLKDRPSYGYEIIRALEERFHGLYVPSAGTIYPTLQMLEEMGYVTSVEQDGKKVYTITGGGKAFLDEHGGLEEKIRERLSDWGNPRNIDDVVKTMHEFGQFAEMLKWEVRKMDSKKLGRVRKVLARAYDDIEGILRG